MDIKNNLMKVRSIVITWLKLGALFLVLAVLAACSTTSGGGGHGYYGGDGPPPGNVDVSKIPNAVPRAEPRSKYGNPSSYTVSGYRYHVLKSAKGYDKVGYASWYGTKFHSKLTSTRESYNMYSMTAASTVLPLPTFVRVTNLKNGHSVIVKVNDRGPFKSSRIIDLSYAAAKKLGYVGHGTALVRVTAIVPGDERSHYYAKNTQSTKPGHAQHTPEHYAANETARAEKYLQIGAYSNQDTAKHVAQKIAVLTHTPVSVKPGYAKNGRVYRVHIGPVMGDAKYDALKQQLAQHGFGQPMMVSG